MGGKSGFSKFLLLMWKNWKLHRRRPLRTVLEILSPVIFSILLILLRSLVDIKNEPSVIYKPFCALPLNISICGISNTTNETSETNETVANNPTGDLNAFQLDQLMVVYSPPNEIIDRAMSVYSFFMKVKAYNSNLELVNHFNTDEGNFTIAAIQFDDDLLGKSTVPKDLKVILRFPSELRFTIDRRIRVPNWRTYGLYPLYEPTGPRSPENDTGAEPSYFREGFLALQHTLTYFLILSEQNLISNNTTTFNPMMFSSLPLITMQRFPYADYTIDPLLKALEAFVGLIIFLSFTYPCMNTVKRIIYEKENQLKECMKIMGLPNWAHWTAWFFEAFLLLFLSVILTIILLTIPWSPYSTYSVFTKSDRLVLLMFMLTYVCATITFCFAISVFFSKANIGATIGAVIFFLTYVPFIFLSRKNDSLSLTAKLVSSLALNTAMGFGFQVVLMFEERGEGIQWSNVDKTITIDYNLTIGHLMLMLCLDAVLYLIIALYVEAVFPGEYGLGKRWYFLCTRSFWCGGSKPIAAEDYYNVPIDLKSDEFFDTEPQNLVAGVQIKHLRKTYGKSTAVNNLTLDMYEGQITVLLGHNGAGKTTTMSMLTGMIPPTSGTAIIDGYDIRSSMDEVRYCLGLCPQHDILFEDLTVKEHLYFFSKLKGLKGKEIDDEIKKYLALLDLVPKANAISATLSGGMKRKLCIAMAFCGNSKVVMLDEPTAGVDPSARRSVWELIQSQKEGRTILLTTHFMDEADLLGDRIAIMARGHLKCCGSSFFLKKKYGTGYRLVIDKTTTCKPQAITEILMQYIPDVKVESNAGTKLTYLLGERESDVFPNMLRTLDQNTAKLGVKSYGISLTTLEEVFLKVGADPKESSPASDPKLVPANKLDSNNTDVTSDFKPTELLTGLRLLMNQVLAMLMKKALSIVRSWAVYSIAIFLPVVFLIISILQARTFISYELPPLEFSLDQYDDPITVMEIIVASKYSQGYSSLIESQRHRVDHVSNITALMFDLTKRVPVTVRTRYLVGATFNETEFPNTTFKMPVIKVWFNNDAYHTPGLAMQLLLNTVYKEQLGDEYDIRFVNHPLPYKVDAQVKNTLDSSGTGFQIAFFIGFAMSFVTSIFLLFYIRERASKSKHLQLVCGTNVLIFWLTSYVCDLIMFAIITIAMILTLVALQEDGFRTMADFVRIFNIMSFFSICVLPIMYLTSFLYKIPSTSFVRSAFAAVIFGCTAFLVVNVLSEPNLELEYIADIINWIFLPVPHYSLCSGVINMYVTYASYKACNEVVEQCTKFGDFTKKMCWQRICEAMPKHCCNPKTDYYKWEEPGIGRHILFAWVLTIASFSILFLIEYRIFHRIQYVLMQKKHRSFEDPVDEDSDVAQEKSKIRNTPKADLLQEYTLVLKNLSKSYKDLIAVNNLCLGVQEKECFGLLGINGAGKTTTFRILTGDIRMTHGRAWVSGYDVTSNMKQVQKRIGYCPQFDAILDNLTANETLIMYCLIRGVPVTKCRSVANRLSVDFDFQAHLHKQVTKLSGGNKRKLSTAISLIGDPKVVYLDEPTTGMDPATKRYLWNKLTDVSSSGKCLVLTSHSMEECEALCTRVAIMVNGRFMCLGSIQHLKNKFSEGCTLTVKVKKNMDTLPIENYIREKFRDTVMQEKHQELMTFYIKDKLSWPDMFSILERAKSELEIEDYSLAQTSLEQVFLSFTKHQEPNVKV